MTSNITNQPPEHIDPRSLFDMNIEDIDKMLDDIRERRLAAARHHEAAMKAAKDAADEKASMSLLKQCEMLSNAFVTIDKQIERMESRVNKIRALRLELGLD